MDTIGNMLTTIYNAQLVKKERVAVPYSSFSQNLAGLLQSMGLLASVRRQEGPRPNLVLTLQYDEQGAPRIHGVRRLSRPGQRRYVASGSIPYSFDGFGSVIVSTPQGLMDDAKARELGLGGELVCEVW